MASKTPLDAEILETLGVERLAALLMEFAAGDAALKRRLRLEVAAENPDALTGEIRKRLNTIDRSRSFVDWRDAGGVAGDLEIQRCAIVEKVAKAEPEAALDLLWRFMDLATSVFERSDDSNGVIDEVFSDACRNIGEVAVLAGVEPVALGDRVYEALIENDYGQYDGLIASTAPALGQSGLEHLKHRMLALAQEPVDRLPEAERRVIGRMLDGSGRVIYADDIAENSRKTIVRQALKDIADAQGDVDAFIAQHDEESRRIPTVAIALGQRLLAAGRAEEALAFIEAAEDCESSDWEWPDFEWEDTRIDALEALGRGDDAQKARWNCFERSLSSSHLRAYLKKLPDFDDVEAEERALTHAEGYRSREGALSFLVSWPALDRAARLVIEHAGALNGDRYGILSPAADALAARHPLAATLLLRTMIEFCLTKRRASRYTYAVRDLLACASLAKGIADFGAFEPHDAYEVRLRQEHGRKWSFWRKLG